ncbi:hypothetical protein [Neisseria weaveri]|uniref:hypothetical protein n=1 Tax=Neisseria weaveri TaxID=28091 RepID=UPI000A8A6316|nr:hypothetical protein [Neisseria weaveri]
MSLIKIFPPYSANAACPGEKPTVKPNSLFIYKGFTLAEFLQGYVLEVDSLSVGLSYYPKQQA